MQNFSAGLRITGLNDFLGPEKECVVIQPPLRKQDDMEMEVEIPSQEKLKPAKISLTDCLACSGCVTSAESILIEAQSLPEFMQKIKQPNQLNVMSFSSNALASLATHFGLPVPILFAKLTTVLAGIGVHHVFSTSVAHDISLLYAANEFVQRKKRFVAGDQTSLLPLITADCPGWICYAEKTQSDYVLPYISNVKSAQQVMGSIVHGPLRESLMLPPTSTIFHVCVMQCYDKKLEASRPDFKQQTGDEVRSDVDMVLAAKEMAQLISELNVDLQQVPSTLPTHPLAALSITCGPEAGSSGGYLDFIFKFAAKEIYGVQIDKIEWVQGRNTDFQECQLKVNGSVVLSMARANGFRNIQNIIRRIKLKNSKYDYVELMACPGGCNNGGGQTEPPQGIEAKEWLKRVDEHYFGEHALMAPEANASSRHLIQDWFMKHNSDLFTQYHALKKTSTAISIDW